MIVLISSLVLGVLSAFLMIFFDFFQKKSARFLITQLPVIVGLLGAIAYVVSLVIHPFAWSVAAFTIAQSCISFEITNYATRMCVPMWVKAFVKRTILLVTLVGVSSLFFVTNAYIVLPAICMVTLVVIHFQVARALRAMNRPTEQ